MPTKKNYKTNQNSAVDLYSMSIQDQKPSLLRGSSSLAADTMTPDRHKSVISMPLYAKKIQPKAFKSTSSQVDKFEEILKLYP